MEQYLEKFNPIIKEYYKTISEDFPEFLIDYIKTPRMQKQNGISITCGTYYSKMFNINLWYSSLEHSIAVALIIWHFTHDKKQTLAGLFHDISTPAFKHCIDFMNNDYEKQESTEELTEKMLLESKEIMELLRRDNIKIEEVSDYKKYPIADNDTPMLSADRLEYTLSNGLGAVKKVWELEEVKEVYKDIKILKNEKGIDELGFKNIKYAEKFVEKMSILTIYYMNDQRRFAMQLLADIMKKMSQDGDITISDLYNLSEEEVIKKIEKCKKHNINNCYSKWSNGLDVNTSKDSINDKYCIKVKAKKRYINPLVETDNGNIRISELSKKAKENIAKALEYDFDRYIYMDFKLN